MASIKYRFPDDPNKKWNNNHQNTFTNLSEKYEIQENDELIINNNWLLRKIKAKKFRWEKGDKWEKWDIWPIWIQWPKWDNWERWEKGDKWEKWDTWPAWRDWRDWVGVGDLLSSNNLSDLVDKVEARKNLKVYSKDEVDSKKTDSDNKIDLINTDLLNKVDKIVWYWLSKNDFTDAALAKLNSINPDLFAKLNSENIFTKDQTIKHDWVNLNLDSSSHSSLRYKQNWTDIFAVSVWTEKNFKISRFVNGNWVWDAMTINNSNWKIWFGMINNSDNTVQINWWWMNVTWDGSPMKIEIRDNRILPWCNWYNAEIGWWAFTWDIEIFWIWSSKKMVLSASSIKLLNIKKEPDIYGLSSWDIYLKKFRDDYYLSLIP